MRLCAYDELCPNGTGHAPIGAPDIDGDTWIPILEQQNGNKWIQAGTRVGGKCNPLSTYHNDTVCTWCNNKTFKESF